MCFWQAAQAACCALQRLAHLHGKLDGIPVTQHIHALQVLLKNEYARSASHIGLQSTKVIEKVDDSTIVFSGVWQAGGWAAALLAPRDVVIKRTWRCATSDTLMAHRRMVRR